MKIGRKLLGMLLFGAGLAYILLVGLALSFSLPNETIRTNIEKASKIITKEGKYPVDFIGDKGNRLDNFTDSIILMVAYNSDKGKRSPFELALTNSYYQTNGNPVKGLETMTTDEEVKTNHNYTRYWFGTSGVVRFLMSFMSIKGVRKVLMATIFSLIVAVIILLTRKLGWRYGALFATSMFFVRPWVIGESLQFAPLFVVAFLGMIAVCLMDGWKKRNRSLPYLFITLGVLTAFFDLLTCPLISLGLPLVLVLLFDKKRGEDKWLGNVIKYSIIWGISYAGMYIFKWGITSLVLNQNIFEIAVKQLLFRTDAAGDYSKIGTVVENYKYYLGTAGAVVVAVFTIVSVVKIIRNGGVTKKNLVSGLPFLIVALYPVLWYLVLSNHSWIHTWMTYRLVVVSMMAYAFGVVSLLEDSRLKKNSFI